MTLFELNPLPAASKPETHHPNCVCNLHEHAWYRNLRPIPKILRDQGFIGKVFADAPATVEDDK